MKRKRAIPHILPREPLTKKARAAISKYASLRSKSPRGLPIHEFMVDYVLKAERMRRADLYAYLEERGFKWVRGSWVKRKTPARRPAPVKGQPVAAQKTPTPDVAPEMDDEALRQFIIDNASTIRARRD